MESAALASVGAGDLGAVADYLARQQADRARHVAYCGETPEQIVADLHALRPPWTSTARVVWAPDGQIRGVVILEVDQDVGRAWIWGPWADEWDAHARPLLDAARAQAPAGVDAFEISGAVEHVRMAALAAALGWAPTSVNHALEADAAALAAGPRPTVPIRGARAADEAAVAPLHAAEFPDTYASAAQLVGGDRYLTVVAPGPPFLGYASGSVQPDGSGYVDFLAVEPEARGRGVAPSLLAALVAALGTPTVSLTVQDERIPARRLYDRLGFRPVISIVGYRSWTRGEQGITRFG